MSAWRIQRPESAFSHDRDRKSRGGRRKEADHLAYIRKLPCCVCGLRRNTEAAHIRLPSPFYAKGKTGMGTKPDDAFVTPLCAEHHRTGEGAQHSGSEAEFWERHGIDPFAVASALYVCSATGDVDAGELVIQAHRQKARKVTV